MSLIDVIIFDNVILTVGKKFWLECCETFIYSLKCAQVTTNDFGATDAVLITYKKDESIAKEVKHYLSRQQRITISKTNWANAGGCHRTGGILVILEESDFESFTADDLLICVAGQSSVV